MFSRYLRKRKAARLTESYYRHRSEVATLADELDAVRRREFKRFVLLQLLPQVLTLLRLMGKEELAAQIESADIDDMDLLAAILNESASSVWKDKHEVEKRTELASWSASVAGVASETGDPFWTAQASRLQLRAAHVDILHQMLDTTWSALSEAEDLATVLRKGQRRKGEDVDVELAAETVSNTAKSAASISTAFSRGKPVERYDPAEIAGLEAGLAVAAAQRDWLLNHPFERT